MECQKCIFLVHVRFGLLATCVYIIVWMPNITSKHCMFAFCIPVSCMLCQLTCDFPQEMLVFFYLGKPAATATLTVLLVRGFLHGFSAGACIFYLGKPAITAMLTLLLVSGSLQIVAVKTKYLNYESHIARSNQNVLGIKSTVPQKLRGWLRYYCWCIKQLSHNLFYF